MNSLSKLRLPGVTSHPYPRPFSHFSRSIPPVFRCQHLIINSASNDTVSSIEKPKSAKEAVESGLLLFNDKKNYAEAIQLFNTAMQLQPTEDEAMAALYNLGCAYAKMKQWKPASEAIVRAINDYRLKLSVALKDEDLKELRERREWIDALTEVKGGLSREMKLDLRSEAKAPFRFPRQFLFGGLAVGAAIGLIIITGRLVLAVKGGEGAPDLTETLQNFAINSAVLAVLGVLLYRDAQAKQRALQVSDREELLSRLQVDLGNGRVFPLLRFRGMVRPFLLAGSKAFVDKAMREAEPYVNKLRQRGVSVIPLVLTEKNGGKKELDPDAKILALKKEFQRKDLASNKGFGGNKVEKEEQAVEPEAAGVTEEDKKWRLEAYDPAEWQTWIEQQKEFANITGEDRNCYIQVQLDGTVRSSALGAPKWARIVDALPPLDDIRTSLSDGVGTSV
ncbi:hypothetical protein CEUSTIGMA_g4923.t1 [Chlamydomonas eustigma]|uniref:Uncharacterized protein n=1 Tax=Chlamydomonas eustigma TaxID=1157962 RepID=A0A250X3H4_9CHLO|nr:hypothetical protein CEUSTIGMA_g4923.t1 [Chlamydomonas eustigma]|eukprot:GAX77479.1 hypothetical protein CEUSTIGMA_g4923.t1 [Chlamydomonas eustigma]